LCFVFFAKFGLCAPPLLQVTARMQAAATHSTAAGGQSRPPPPPAGGDRSSGLNAALGTKWAHYVNVRLILEREGDKRSLKVKYFFSSFFFRWRNPHQRRSIFLLLLANGVIETYLVGGDLHFEVQPAYIVPAVHLIPLYDFPL
jgi:hypothetical protein